MVTANFLFILFYFIFFITDKNRRRVGTLHNSFQVRKRIQSYPLQYSHHMPERRRNKIKMSMHYNNNNNNNKKTENMRTVFSLQAGLLSLDSQTAMAKIGCVTMVDGGMTNKLPLERQTTLQRTTI